MSTQDETPRKPMNELRECPLYGQWRHNNGYICCGTLRIAKADFDTDPSPEFQQRVFDWVCQQLNASPPTPTAAMDVETIARRFSHQMNAGIQGERLVELVKSAITEAIAPLHQQLAEKTAEVEEHKQNFRDTFQLLHVYGKKPEESLQMFLHRSKAQLATAEERVRELEQKLATVEKHITTPATIEFIATKTAGK